MFEFSVEHPGVQILSADSMYLSGKIASRDDSCVFYIELLNTNVSVCSCKVRPTTYYGVYFVIEPITETPLEISYNSDAIPNSVYETKIEFVHFNKHLARQRIVNFIKNEIRNTLQLILNGLISLASNLDNTKLFLGSGSMVGIHAGIQVVYPTYTLTAFDPIAPHMYRISEGIWIHYVDDNSVARPPESLSF